MFAQIAHNEYIKIILRRLKRFIENDEKNFSFFVFFRKIKNETS